MSQSLQQSDESTSLLQTSSCNNTARRSSIFSMRHVPLFLTEDSEDDVFNGTVFDVIDEDDASIVEEHGSASRAETVLNITKTCLGTGMIAIPYAASQIECWIHITGVLVIALWCLLCIQRLLSCLDLVHYLKDGGEVDFPKQCSGLGEVAFFAFGKTGLHVMDVVFFFLLFMIIVAYLDAALGFLQDTFLATTNPLWNVLVPAVIIGVLASGEDMESLSKVSGLGIGMVIFVFGIIVSGYGDLKNASSGWPTTETTKTNFAQWYGTIVFGFGLVPLTYNFRASMEKPSDMMVASTVGLAGTCLMYVVMSVGVIVVFPPDSLQGDVLQLLPNEGILPTVVRLAMVGLVVTTAPLLVLPCGELIQDEIFPSDLSPIWIRVSICVLAAVLTLHLPDFVFVLSFVGSCWCIMSFVIPPLFHFALWNKVRTIRHQNDASNNNLAGREAPWIFKESYRTYWMDLSMILFGAIATIASSVYTFQGLLGSNNSS